MARQTARQKQDAGTGYSKALDGDPSFTLEQRAMAIWCESIVGQSRAFSPRLVWEGAVAAGLAPAQLYKAFDAQDWETIEFLMFCEPASRKWQKAAAGLAARLPR